MQWRQIDFVSDDPQGHLLEAWANRRNILKGPRRQDRLELGVIPIVTKPNGEQGTMVERSPARMDQDVMLSTEAQPEKARIHRHDRSARRIGKFDESSAETQEHKRPRLQSLGGDEQVPVSVAVQGLFSSNVGDV